MAFLENEKERKSSLKKVDIYSNPFSYINQQNGLSDSIFTLEEQ